MSNKGLKKIVYYFLTFKSAYKTKYWLLKNMKQIQFHSSDSIEHSQVTMTDDRAIFDGVEALGSAVKTVTA